MFHPQQRGTVKVDQARKRGNIAIVSQHWLTESIAQWRRLEERPYLLEEPTPAPSRPTMPHAGPASHPISSSEPPGPSVSVVEDHSAEMDDEEEDWEEEEISTYDAHKGGPGALELSAIDWNDINDEVDAAMNESSDDEDEQFDDTRSDRSVDERTDDDSVRRCV